MSLGGTYSDHWKDMFKDNLMHEAQQMGSRLQQVCNVEAMEGNKTHFDKLGKATATEKSSRLETRQYAEQTFERRHVTETLAEYSTAIDIEDAIKHASNPKSELTKAAVNALARQKDSVIINAISGNASVTTNGSSANQALTLSVVVADHTYDSGSGDVGLTPGKLKKAIRLLKENYGDNGSSKMYVVAPNKQIMNLTTDTEVISKDFRNSAVVEGPGIVSSLSGYLGLEFIEYEDTGVDGSDDEKVFLLTDDAIKLGIFQTLTIDQFKDTTRIGSPDALAVYEAIGSTRMDENKVVEILCDPLA